RLHAHDGTHLKLAVDKASADTRALDGGRIACVPEEGAPAAAAVVPRHLAKGRHCAREQGSDHEGAKTAIDPPLHPDGAARVHARLGLQHEALAVGQDKPLPDDEGPPVAIGALALM